MAFCESCGDFIEFRRINDRNIPIHKCPSPPSYRSLAIETPFVASAFLEPCIVCGQEVLLLVSLRGRKAYFNEVSWPLVAHLHLGGSPASPTRANASIKDWPNDSFRVHRVEDVKGALRIWLHAEALTECIELEEAEIDRRNAIIADLEDSPLIEVVKTDHKRVIVTWFSFTAKKMHSLSCKHNYTGQRPTV